ncbi:autophagy protein [Agyrium rufum]|nr:autophagy protein [Agyrium rufum]
MSMNFVTFNQDHSHLAVGTSRGFRIYTTDPFTKVFETKEGDIAILEMLFSTSLVALILSPRRLQITNTKRQSTICELTFPTTVLAVRLNRKRLVVVLEDQIYLYDISNMQLLSTIETSPNSHAIVALSSSSDNCYLAYPLPQKSPPSAFTSPAHKPPGQHNASSAHLPPTSGSVLLFDTLKLVAVNVAEAHRSQLSCVSLNNTGTLLATASDKGTIIRVFGVPSAQKLFQFRRGTMPSRIYSMSFNSTSSLLCVSSASETIHIFKLGGPRRRRTSATNQGPSCSDSGSSHQDYRSKNPHTRSISPSSTSRASSTSPSTYARTSQNELSLTQTLSNDLDNLLNTSPPNASGGSRKHNGTLFGMIRRTSQNVGSSLATSVGAYLPSVVSEMWEPERDFAWCRIPRTNAGTNPSHVGGAGGGNVGGRSVNGNGGTGNLRSVVAMSGNSPQVMVVTNEGKFYCFTVDLERGGEGILGKTYEVGSGAEGFLKEE